MKLTMLGTGHAIVTKCYNTCFVLQENEDYFLVDGGGGNQLLQQLERAKIDWKQIKHIFVTHKHIDHLLGIVWMIRMICQGMLHNTYEGEATIYAHDEVIGLLKEITNKLLLIKETQFFDDRLHFVIVEDEEEKTILTHTVRFFDIHSVKAKQFGFCMEIGNGEKLTCCGDEPYHGQGMDYIKGSKWLLHEAFCLHAEADIFHPYEKQHSTVKDACQIAEQLGVKNVLLYHTEDKNIEDRKELYKKEGQCYFSGDIYIPKDLETIEL